MLVLSRRLHEKILIPEIHTTIEVVSVKSGVVRLGIEAPLEVKILREELRARPVEGEINQDQSEDRAGRLNFRELQHFLRGQLYATGLALALLRRQLLAGQPQFAEATLAKLTEDFQLMGERLAAEGEHALPEPPKRPGKAAKALLVEDNQNERELLAFFLRQSGLNVDTAGDGSEALDYLCCHAKPDVILLDMGLPRVDGPTTIREIRRNPAFAGLKIFGVTGHLPEEFDLELGPRGINGWFQKPLDPTALFHQLTHNLDNPLAGI
jgi:two-component system, OmpR family, response regulator